VEDRFNKNGYHYPYVFLNDEPFSKEFIESTSSLVSGNTSYGIIPKSHWEEPEWIDEERAAASRAVLEEKKVCHPILQK